MDITYIPMARGFVYLAAVIDWFSRKVLTWRLSITLSADFCIEALEEALARHGGTDIFNTDQGSPFTSVEFIKVLKSAEITISMDGKGSAYTPTARQCLRRAALADGEPKDRAAKYEEVYLRAYGSVSEARASIGRYLGLYNGTRPQSSLDGQTPDQACLSQPAPIPAAAQPRPRSTQQQPRSCSDKPRHLCIAATATVPCCRSCSTRSRRTKRSLR